MENTHIYIYIFEIPTNWETQKKEEEGMHEEAGVEASRRTDVMCFFPAIVEAMMAGGIRWRNPFNAKNTKMVNLRPFPGARSATHSKQHFACKQTVKNKPISPYIAIYCHILQNKLTSKQKGGNSGT